MLRVFRTGRLQKRSQPFVFNFNDVCLLIADSKVLFFSSADITEPCIAERFQMVQRPPRRLLKIDDNRVAQFFIVCMVDVHDVVERPHALLQAGKIDPSDDD